MQTSNAHDSYKRDCQKEVQALEDTRRQLKEEIDGLNQQKTEYDEELVRLSIHYQ
jgi:uncharacterized coiled-coil DUF342 family protein